MMRQSRHMPVKGAFNLRDLGGYQTASGSMTPWRHFLRSDSLHRITPTEVSRLHDEGLRAVIDLRTTREVTEAPNPFAVFPDVHFVNMPLFDDLSPQALSHQGTDKDHPLFSLYMTAVDSRGPAISAILTEMAQIETGAVLFNCTAGKDRTGIIAALLLGIAEVPRDQIVADYTMTAELIPELVAEFLDLSRARGGDAKRYARLLESPAETITATLEHIDMRYGTVPDYLRSIGLSTKALDRLRLRLIG